MPFTKVAPAGIGTEPGTSILIGDSLLHSTGIDIGSNTGIGVTIRKHGDATFTGIITASAFFGDGAGLEGVSSSGIGTPLSDDDTSQLNKIYYVNQELSIGSTVTINHPDSAVASYTHYQDLVVKDDADFIVTDGDTFIPDVLGIRTSTSTNASSATGGRIRAGTITNAGANGAPNFPNGVTGTSATFTTGTITGNLGVGGVLTYEDVTNVDSVGLVTARSGIRVPTGLVMIGTSDAGHASADDLTINNSGHGGITIRTGTTSNGAIFFADSTSGDARFDGFVQYNHGTNPYILFGTAGNERLRIGSAGQIGIAGANYGTSGQFLKSTGSGSAVQWASPVVAGSILQTVYNSTTSEGGTTSSSFQNWSGLATNITPLSSTSHLWIWINAIRLNVQQDGNEGRLRVTDGTNSTEIYRCFNYDSDNNYLSFNPCLNWYWPQTHTAGTQITLTPQLRSMNGSGNVIWGDNGDESYMIVQEIAR